MPIAASTFTGVDLTTIPPPAVVQTLSFEVVLANWLAQFQVQCTAAGIDYTAILESDPAYKLLEVGAYQELILRQRINDAAKACMVAYASGADLDNLAALVDVERYVVTAADPLNSVFEVDETDTALRQRTVLAPQGYSVAGPEGAYVSFALSADPSVRDVSVDNPSPGRVLITVLSYGGTGAPSPAALAAVTAQLTAATVRPLTDAVSVQAAGIVDYSIAATLYFLAGYDHGLLTANAQAALATYLAKTSLLGRTITRAGISAALFVTGMDNITLVSPANDIACSFQQAGYCTAIALSDGGNAA